MEKNEEIYISANRKKELRTILKEEVERFLWEEPDTYSNLIYWLVDAHGLSDEEKQYIEELQIGILVKE